MSPIDPMSLTFTYSLQYQGIPHPGHVPEDYPLRWNVTAALDVAAEEEDEYDPETRHAAFALAYLIPDAGDIDLFDTMDAVGQELSNVAEHLCIRRPDLLEQLDGDRSDLVYLSSLEVDEDLRGNKLGYVVLNAGLETVGRSAQLALLRPSPILTGTVPEEGTPAHDAEVAALRRYWEGFGFYDIGGGYMAFGGVEGAVRNLVDESYLDAAGFERVE